MRNKKGFTLVELVIVIAVIAILAGVMIGTFSSVVNNAKKSADLQEIKQNIDEKYLNYVADEKKNPNCFTWTTEETKNIGSIDFTWNDELDKIDISGITEDISEKLTKLNAGIAYIPITEGSSAETGSDENLQADATSTVTLGDAINDVPTEAGNYLVVEFTVSGENKTVGNKYVMVVAVAKGSDSESEEGGSTTNTTTDSTTTYYSTYLEVLGQKKTTVVLSFDENGSYKVENKKD